MRGSVFAMGAASLAGVASAQSYCDDLGRCFASHTSNNGIRFGIAIPKVSAAPFDAILQVTAPIAVKWVGVSWGGSMTYQPLTISWPNGDELMSSPRVAYSYSVPPTYEGATNRLLEGSYVNATHWVATTFCDGCSEWADLGSTPSKLDPNAQQNIGYAWGSVPVNDPDNIDTTFAMHDAANRYKVNLANAQSADFGKWIGDGGGSDPDPEPTPTSSPTTSSVESPTSTPTEPPPEEGEPLPFPTTCNLQGQFPLEVASGWKFVKLLGGLRTPRGITVDSKGNILLIQVGVGLTVHTFDAQTGCIASSKTLISRPQLTHGVALTPDGATLYISSISTVWRYAYDAETQTVSEETIVVKNMYPSTHSTRTVVVPPATPNLLVVSLGSDGNIDGPSVVKETGRAIVKTFDISTAPSGGWDYSTQGNYLGYGLRNEVAIAVDGNNMVWGVENSADEFARTINGTSTPIVEENPAEELNYLGDPTVSNENWYGYPTCFTVWGGELFPDGNPETGSQFLPAPNSTFTDATCEERSTPPRLALRAHAAPLDAKFDQDGQNLFVSLHGSWNRRNPYGYKVVTIPFTQNAEGGYEPVAAPDSQDGYDDILWDPQTGCNSSKCFRPSGLTWDKEFTRLIIASDNSAQGELYLLARTT